MTKIIDEIKTDIITQYNAFFIYGAGDYGKKIAEVFEFENTSDRITAFVVTDKKCNESGVLNKRVIEYDELTEYRDVKIGIILGFLSPDKKQTISLLESLKIDIDIYVPTSIAYERLSIKINDIRILNNNREIDSYYKKYLDRNELFKYIEIETVNRCNGVCEFCPVNANAVQREYKKMDRALYMSIIRQLTELNYEGKVALFSNNEPFLDERIIEFAEYARVHLPKAYIYLFTNGTLLTDERYLSIMPYLNRMHIDSYVSNEKSEPEKVLHIKDLAKRYGYEDRMTYSLIPLDAIRSSRGGEAPNKKIKEPINALCRLPFIQMVIRPDGKVSLCCNDALGKITLGDITEKSIIDIWNGTEFHKVRTEMMVGRKTISLCKGCDYVDYREM